MLWPSKVFENKKKIEKMPRVQKYFQFPNQRVRFNFNQDKKKLSLFYQVTRTTDRWRNYRAPI